MNTWLMRMPSLDGYMMPWLQKGILDNTIVIVTADHGELFERGIVGHETPALYEPLIHIPLLISVPGQTQRQDVYSLTSCVDLLPTLAKLTGQPAPEWGEGVVLPGFRDEPAQNERSVFAVEAKSSSKLGPLKKLTVAMIKENYKLIYYRGYPKTPAPELFDLSNDPEELQDLASTKPSIAADLQQEIEAKLRQTTFVLRLADLIIFSRQFPAGFLLRYSSRLACHSRPVQGFHNISSPHSHQI